MYINPYEYSCKDKTQCLKANFHMHAGTGEGTCGTHELDQVISLYKQAGYDVLTISNHDICMDLSEYQEKYDIVLLNGFEYSQNLHMICVNVNELITGLHQETIDECTKQGGFTILCHPNWKYKEYWPWRQIDALSGYSGIEIYNSVIFRLKGTGLATDTWDYLLSQGKLVWGFGSDDFHRLYDANRAWNMIYTSSAKHKQITDSLLNGSFYVSTGLILDDFKFTEDTIRVKVGAGDTYVKTYKYLFIGSNGEILREQCSEYGEYRLTGNEQYIRVQAVSEHGAMLWTQPVYKKEAFKKP